MSGRNSRVTRFDQGELSKAVRTPQGFLRAPAFATRTGVFTYRFPDGSVRRELRHPDDVFAADSLATLAGVPVTDDHPSVLVDASNSRLLMVGYTGDDVGEADGKFVSCVATVTDDKAIAKVEGGKVEVSCGYTCEHELVAGEYEGEPYDVRQRSIVYNHLAIVDRGRAGPDVRIRLDAADAVQVSQPSKESQTMVKIKINGVEFDVTPELKAAIEAALAAGQTALDATAPALAAAQAQATDQTQRADKAEAKVDGLTAELAKVKAEVAARTDAADPKVIDARVKARLRIVRVAERVLKADELAKLDGADDKALMAAVIAVEAKDVKLDGKSDAYVEARFDMIAEAIGTGDDGKRKLGADLHTSRADAQEPDAEAARKRAMERSANAWKPKTGTDNK